MRILAIGLVATLSGCAGLDASSSFACKAPEGVNCQSLSGTYANSVAGSLPSQQVHKAGGSTSGDGLSGTGQRDRRYVWADQGGGDQPGIQRYYGGDDGSRLSPRAMAAPSSGTPIRKPPQVLRVWVAPWEDESGDLHDQSYFYTMVSPGRWAIEASRQSISERFKPVYPLKSQGQTPAAEPKPAPKVVAPLSQNGVVPGQAPGMGNPLGGAPVGNVEAE